MEVRHAHPPMALASTRGLIFRAPGGHPTGLRGPPNQDGAGWKNAATRGEMRSFCGGGSSPLLIESGGSEGKLESGRAGARR